MVESTLSLAHLEGLFKRLKGLIRAERYAIFLGPDDRGEFLVAQSHGIKAEQIFTGEPLSLSILRRVSQTRKAYLSEGEPDLHFDSNTYLLSGIQSVLCVPLMGSENQVVGLIYADHLKKNKAFGYTDLLNVQNLLKSLHTQPSNSPPRTKVAAPGKTRSVPTSTHNKVKLSSQDEVQFLVQLSTLVKSGIPLVTGLEAMAVGRASAAQGQAAECILTGILRGLPLATAMQEQVHFEPIVISFLRCSERTGQLALCLELLAQSLEKQRQRQLRLRSSLAYPGFLLLLTLAMSMLLPAYVLKNQLEFYQAQSMSLPWLSLALLRWGQFLSHPFSWLGLPLAAAFLYHSASKARQRWMPRFQRLVNHLPVLGRLQRLLWECRLLQSLHLLLTPGVDLLESVQLSIETSGSYLWKAAEVSILNDLRNGESLSLSLVRPGLTQVSTRPLLAAAEESGRLAHGLAWVAQWYELELELCLEGLSKALEPLVMAMMGVIVGLVTLASLLPSIRYIQEL